MSKQATATLACTLLLALASAILGGCGGGTKTVTVSGASESAANTTSSTTSRSSQAGTTSATSATTPQSATTGGSQSPGGAASTTRTAPEPAFAQHDGTGGGAEATDEEATGEEAAAAVAAVKTHGYTPSDVSQYHPDQTLRVLVGTRSGSADGYDQRAFFFLDGKYLGTDSSQPSASIRVVAQSDTEVVLAYALYRPHDPLCCASGGQSTVHFQLNNGQLVPLQPIPPASSASGLSRQ